MFEFTIQLGASEMIKRNQDYVAAGGYGAWDKGNKLSLPKGVKLVPMGDPKALADALGEPRWDETQRIVETGQKRKQDCND